MNQTDRTALLAGATGLVGNALLKKLLADPFYTKVKVITRRSLDLSHPKMSEILTSFDDLEKFKNEIQGNDVFCCLGTTMKKAGSKKAFYRVDHTYVFELARLAKENGAESFLLVSALGAAKKSPVYYNRVKGEIEDDLSKLGYESLFIFRPSLLLGDRQEQRAGEDVAKNVYRVINPILPAKYKAIQASDVAGAMLNTAKNSGPGIRIILSDEIRKIASINSD